MTIKSAPLPTAKYLRAIHYMGLLICVGLTAILLNGFVDRVGDVFAEGPGAFLLWVLTKVVGIVIFGGIAILPYAVGSFAVRTTGAGLTIATLCFFVFAFNVWMLTKFVLFSAPSSLPAGLIFIPIFLSMVVATFWFVVIMANALRRWFMGI